MGAAAFLLRTLLPSWRFFVDTDYIPQLFYRTRKLSSEYSSWRPGFVAAPRRFDHLLLNPQGNHSLALFNLLDRLVDEANATEDASEMPASVTYRLIERWVRLAIKSEAAVDQFQFKIMMLPTQGASEPRELLRSLEHDV